MIYLALFFGVGTAATCFLKNPIAGFSLSAAITVIAGILESIAAIKQILE